MSLRARIGGLVVLACAACLAGCHDPAHEAAVQQRLDGMQHALDTYQKMEQTRPQDMANTLEVARNQYRHDVEQTQENPHRVHQAVQQEFDRFEDNQPAYRSMIEQQLRGNPDSIEKNLPRLLY